MGLRDSRAGYELTVSVNQATRALTKFRWVNGVVELADSLTKSESRKVLLQFFGQKQFWRLVHDEKFVAGRKLRKRELEKQLDQEEIRFVQWVKDQAAKHHWPWDDGPMIRYHPFS